MYSFSPKLLILFLILFSVTFAQENTINSYLESLDPVQLELAGENLTDNITTLLDAPFYIPDLTMQDLLSIPLVTPSEARDIVDYIANNSPVLSKQELTEINQIPYDKIMYILSFLTLEPPLKIKDYYYIPATVRLRTRTYSNENNYEYKSAGYYNKFEAENKHYRAFLLSAKDPGENNFTDFLSYGILIKSLPADGKLIIGNFRYKFAKGLLLNNSYGIFKDIGMLNSYHSITTSLNTGNDESDYLRGVSFELQPIKYLTLSGFYSYKKRNAAYDEVNNLYTLRNTGLHISPADFAARNNISEKTAGFATGYSPFNNLTLNFLFLSVQYSETIKTNAGNFTGINGISGGYDYLTERLRFSGEVAKSGNYSANLHSIEITPYHFITLSLLYRNSHGDYFAPYQNSYSEFSSSNETGLAFGIKFSGGFGVINLLHDTYKLKPYSSNLFESNHGNDFSLKYYSANFNNFRINFSFTNTSNTYENFNKTEKENIYRIKLQPVKKISEGFETKFNYNITICDNYESSFGYSCEWINKINLFSNLDIIINLLIFNADNFNSRLFTYAYDVPGSFGILQLFGEGSGTVLLLKYEPASYLKFNLSLRKINKKFNNIRSSQSKFSFQIDLML